MADVKNFLVTFSLRNTTFPSEFFIGLLQMHSYTGCWISFSSLEATDLRIPSGKPWDEDSLCSTRRLLRGRTDNPRMFIVSKLNISEHSRIISVSFSVYVLNLPLLFCLLVYHISVGVILWQLYAFFSRGDLKTNQLELFLILFLAIYAKTLSIRL